MPEGGGAAGGIAGALTTFFVLLPFVLVVVLYLFFTVVTMVHGTDLRGSTVNVRLMMAGMSVITAALVALVSVGVHFIGRSLTPAKRRGDA
jgi:hypothetical protein